jgi:hypothetical protein
MWLPPALLARLPLDTISIRCSRNLQIGDTVVGAGEQIHRPEYMIGCESAPYLSERAKWGGRYTYYLRFPEGLAAQTSEVKLFFYAEDILDGIHRDTLICRVEGKP